MKLGGRYRLETPLGQGGMAEVWRAHDERMGRDVAIKILHTYVHPTERERFFQEVRALSQLSHPGVVQIYDLGEEEGRPFFVMELVEGGSFDRQGPFEDGMAGLQLLEACHQVLDALDYLHHQEIIHRDLTPRNILLGRRGQAKVMDFGLAYLLRDTRHLTRTGYTLGTPQYMAPEQAKGLPLSPAADLYSFGVVVYRTLTGKLPFEGENDQSLLYQHVYETPAPLQKLNAAIPTAVAQFTDQLLGKDPPLRPAARAAHAALEETLHTYREHLSSTARAGLTRTGHYPTGPSQPRQLLQKARYESGGKVAWPGEMVVANHTLNLGAGRGVARVHTLEDRLTRLATTDEVTAPPALHQGLLLAASWDGQLTAYNPSGKIIWRYSSRAEVTAAPSVLGQQILLASRDGFLHALDLQGKLRWALQTRGHLSAPPTLYRGLLFVANEDGWLYAIDPTEGQQRYRVETGPVHAAMPASGGLLLIPTWEGELHAFDPLRREVAWSYDLEGEIWGAPATDGKRVFTVSWEGVLYALDLTSGDEVWKREVGKTTAGLSLAYGILYACTEEGQVLALEADTGQPLWIAEGLGPIQAPAMPYRGEVWVATLAGLLYRFGPES